MGSSEPGESGPEISTALTVRPIAAPVYHVPSTDEFQALRQMMDVISKTEVVPQAFRGKPDAALAAVLYGRELGFTPMVSLKYVQVIQGQVGLAPRAMAALIRQRGHRLEIREATATRSVIYGKRRDTGEEYTSTWTIEQARRAGLVRDGSGWTKYPEDMLFARNMGSLGRRLFEDVVLGSYTPQEFPDGDQGRVLEPDEVIDVEPTPVTGKGGGAPAPAVAGTVTAAGPSPEGKPEAPAPPAPPPPVGKAPPPSTARPSAPQTPKPALAVVPAPDSPPEPPDPAQANLLSIERTTASEMAVKIQRRWAELKYKGQAFPEDVIQAKARLSIQMWSDRTLGQRDLEDKIIKNSGPTLEQMTRPQVQQLIAAMTATLEDKK